MRHLAVVRRSFYPFLENVSLSTMYKILSIMNIKCWLLVYTRLQIMYISGQKNIAPVLLKYMPILWLIMHFA